MRTFHYRYPVKLSEEQRRWLEAMVHMSSTPAKHYLVARVLLMSQAEHLMGNPSLAVVEVIFLDDMAHAVGMKDQGPGTQHRRQRHEITVALAQFP
jgi:hypothetical protein